MQVEAASEDCAMSHFTKVQTQLFCLLTIEKVLEEMELKICKDRVEVRGFGRQRTHADLVVDTGTGMDIGFVQGARGFEVIGDWDFIERRSSLTQKSFMATLKKRYSYFKVLEEVEKAGFTLVEERSDKGEVTLRVRRWT
jgi:hypothetical protein